MSPKCVLIVDDDEMSRELLCVLLAGEGYAVESVDSGEAALALLQRPEFVPDLVLADVQLPGISGAALAGKLRAACGPATLMLAISGSQPPAEAVSSFDGFLLKPFTMQQIAALLARGPEAGAAAKEKWVVVSGPASAPQSARKLVSIQASTPQPASKNDMAGRMQQVTEEQSADNLYDISAQGPVLNEKIYQQLADSMPERQLVEMYTMCVNDARERIARMRRLVASGDGAYFVREAHAIKGGCGMLGATELHRMASVLEKNGLEAVTSVGGQQVNSLDELAAACDRLERMLGSRV